MPNLLLNSSRNNAIFEIRPTCNNYAPKNCIKILLLENEQMAQLGTPVITFGVEKTQNITKSLN